MILAAILVGVCALLGAYLRGPLGALVGALAGLLLVFVVLPAL
jgi:hypothetical protein